MKSFTDLFIKRPVLAMVVSFVILIAGSKAVLPILFPQQLAGLGGLNVRQYPRSDIASITITTVYVGYSSTERSHRLSCAPRAASADGRRRRPEGRHSRRALLCHANLDETRSHGGAQHLASASSHRPFAKQLSCSGRKHKRFASSGKPHGEYRSAHSRRL